MLLSRASLHPRPGATQNQTETKTAKQALTHHLIVFIFHRIMNHGPCIHLNKYCLPIFASLLYLNGTIGFTCIHSRRSSSVGTFLPSTKHLSEQSSSNEKGRKKGGKKPAKRRFAQDVKPIFPQQTSSESQKGPLMDEHEILPSVMRGTSDALKKKQNNNRTFDRNRNMMQSGKSIEELEKIMTSRWGVSAEKWSADLGEYELVYDGEDGNKRTPSPLESERTSPISGSRVRSRAVLDPWQKEERKALYEEKQKRKEEKKKRRHRDNNVDAFSVAKGRNNDVLDRVKRNQQKLQLAKEQKGGNASAVKETAEEKKSSFMEEEDEVIDLPQMTLDFYDEDDEGFEVDQDEGEFYNNIISPKPTGGVGSSPKREKRSDTQENQGFFFFNEDEQNEPSRNNENQNVSKVVVDEKKKEKRKIFRNPAYDENGNEVCLSLNQAQKETDVYLHEQSEFWDEDDSFTTWEDIGITNTQLLENLLKMNCESPLPVQENAGPSILSGNDVLVSTHTGSGKTLAFLAPLAQNILADAGDNSNATGLKAIIVAPGRELASQIVAVARELFKGTGLTAMLAIGGTPFGRNFEQIRKKKPEFIVGTPGRIAELVVGKPGEKSGKLRLSGLQGVVLDECDALIEYKPHQEPTNAIMHVLKRRHKSLQSILCSATAVDLFGENESNTIDMYLREGYAHAKSNENDRLLTVASGKEAIRVSRTAIHGVIHVPHQRFSLDTLRKVLYTEPTPQQVLIFVDNARRVGIVVDKLAQMGIIAAPLHGGNDSEKGDRAEVNKALREGFVGIVVATEMAARGIDAPYLTHVINLDLPTDASHYAHRAGRCGRGGRPGVVVNIAVGPKEKNVPAKFGKALDINMNEVEARSGKLVILEEKESPRI